MSEVIELFPKASHHRPALRQTRVRNGQNMHTFLFRSYHLILESDEADLVRDAARESRTHQRPS
jgi:hypothetical protein